ncbi:MAG: hypothetical protein RLZZ609_2866 [Cyanobacteriota bacterium]|jgi:hypothetical protein
MRESIVEELINRCSMQKSATGVDVLSLLTSPLQDLPASLVITLVATTLMLTTLTTLWLNQSPAPLEQSIARSEVAH